MAKKPKKGSGRPAKPTSVKPPPGGVSSAGKAFASGGVTFAEMTSGPGRASPETRRKRGRG